MMLDQVLIQIKLNSDDLDSFTLNELADQIIVILEIVLAFLLISAEVTLAAYRMACETAALPGKIVQEVAVFFADIFLGEARFYFSG